MPLVSPTEKLAMERGELIGEQRGEQRGKILGAILGKQQLIIRLLNRRIGKIEPSLVEQVQTLTIEQLDLLGETLLDFSTVADLEQ